MEGNIAQLLEIEQNFKISKYIKITHVDNVHLNNEENFQDKCFLFHEKKNKFFLINQSIYEVLKHFDSPLNFSTLVKKIGDQLNFNEAEIKDTMRSFFIEMISKKFIVLENEIQPDIQFTPIFKPNEILISFEILKCISQRKKTEIYLAKSLNNNEEVILKILKHYSFSPSKYKKEYKKFEQEFIILKNLQNNSKICKVLDFIVGDHIILVQEYIQGETLYNEITKNDISLNEKLNLIDQILNTFSFIHSNGFIHGDIHSGNILVDKFKKIKIIDFGLSNRETLEEDEIVNNGGANQFMPPERITTDCFNKFIKESNKLGEVYQLGLIVYFILFKKLPYTGFVWKEMASSILNDSLNIPDILFSEDLNLSFKAILQKALNKNPNSRYPDAISLYDAWVKVVYDLNKIDNNK